MEAATSEQSLSDIMMGLDYNFAVKKIRYCVLDRSCSFFSRAGLNGPSDNRSV